MDNRRRRAQIFAHRGSSGLFAEHTRAAYLRALAEGADGIETDIHLTRDGEAVCFHDATVTRTSNGTGAVADLTLSELRGLDVHSWKTPLLPSEYGRATDQFMTLKDLLEVMLDEQRDLRLAIELKHPSPYGHQLEERVLQVLFAYGWDPESSEIRGEKNTVEISFMSFYPPSLQYLSHIVPLEKLCALMEIVTDEHVRQRLQHLRFSWAAPPVVSAIMRSTVRDAETAVWNSQIGLAGPGIDYVKQCRADVKAWLARGTQLRVWTVNEISDVAFLLDLGVTEITTNYPGRVIETVSAPAGELDPMPA